MFDVLGARGADGRALAGAVVGETLRRFHLVAMAARRSCSLSLAARGVLGPRPRRFALRVAGLLVMVAADVYAGAGRWRRRSPRAADARRRPVDLAERDPRRVEFGRLHGLSMSLQLVPFLGGLALLFFELKD